MKSIPWVPTWIANVFKATIGRLMVSSPPQDGPIGATLELQRQEQIENWEQQMIMNRAREFRNRNGANGAVPPFFHNMMGEQRDPPQRK